MFVSKQQLKDVPCFCQGEERIPEMQEMQQLQNMEDMPSLISEALWCNGKAQHSDQTLLQMCKVKLVDFRKIQSLNAKKIPEGNFYTGGNYD